MSALAAAMARLASTNRTPTNDLPAPGGTFVPGGWTYGDAFGSSTIDPTSTLPCRLDVALPDDPDICYWCGGRLTGSAPHTPYPRSMPTLRKAP